MSTQPARTPYHHGDLRRALLGAATDLLEEGGPAGLSLREVARRAGVSHGAPYRHFPDREALLDAVAAEGFRDLTRQMQDIRRPTPAERLAALGQAYVAAALERPGRFALMFSLTPDPQRHPATAEAAPPLMAVLREAVAEVTGSPDDAAASAAAWALVHGLAHLLLQGHLRGAGSAAEVPALVAAVTERLAGALRVPAGGRGGLASDVADR